MFTVKEGTMVAPTGWCMNAICRRMNDKSFTQGVKIRIAAPVYGLVRNDKELHCAEKSTLNSSLLIPHSSLPKTLKIISNFLLTDR